MRATGLEALMRVQDGTGVQISPSDALARAAQRNFLPLLDRFVARRHILNFKSLALTDE